MRSLTSRKRDETARATINYRGSIEWAPAVTRSRLEKMDRVWVRLMPISLLCLIFHCMTALAPRADVIYTRCLLASLFNGHSLHIGCRIFSKQHCLSNCAFGQWKNYQICWCRRLLCDIILLYMSVCRVNECIPLLKFVFRFFDGGVFNWGLYRGRNRLNCGWYGMDIVCYTEECRGKLNKFFSAGVCLGQ